MSALKGDALDVGGVAGDGGGTMTTGDGSLWTTARATTEPVARQALFDAAHEVDAHRARADAAEAECARLRECLARANGTIEETERARYAAEDDRDAALAAAARCDAHDHALRALADGAVVVPCLVARRGELTAACREALYAFEGAENLRYDRE